jgi:hypothetical protein
MTVDVRARQFARPSTTAGGPLSWRWSGHCSTAASEGTGQLRRVPALT